MLNAFKNHLNRLSTDPKDPFSARIRRLAGGREAPSRCQALRRLILSTPAMVGQIRAWTDEPSMPQRLLRLQKFALAYLYSPVDFLPDEEHGLFGYIDDAFLVGVVHEATRLELEAMGVSVKDNGDYAQADIAAGLEAARKLLPRETDAISRLLSEVEHGKGHEKALAKAAEGGRTGVTR